MSADNGLVLALTLAREDLDALHAYFLDGCDISHGGGSNEEMRLLQAVHRIRMLHERIINGRAPLPRHGYVALGAEGK